MQRSTLKQVKNTCETTDLWSKIIQSKSTIFYTAESKSKEKAHHSTVFYDNRNKKDKKTNN